MSPRPARLRLSRRKGARLPVEAVNVARPSRWGNPFVVGVDGTRLDCVQKFIALLHGYVCVSSKATAAAQQQLIDQCVKHLAELQGRPLACWCQLPKPGEVDLCHAAVLIELASGGPIDLRGMKLQRVT